MAPYELSIAQYQGPFDKLLELIEEQKLDVTDISLAHVTDGFLRHLVALREAGNAAGRAVSPEDLRFLADFIAIASRLIFLKSRALLPELSLAGDEEAGVRDLEARLTAYKELKPAMRAIAELWRSAPPSFSRPYLLNIVSPAMRAAGMRVFYPDSALSAVSLHGALGEVVGVLERMVREGESIRDEVVSLEEKISQIVSRIAEIVETSFAVLTGASSRADMIVTFLAVLHLAREQLLFLEQDGYGSDILIRQAPLAH